MTTHRAPQGMVCAVDQLAAVAGVAMLHDGGSAADAAVAASAVLAVTTQHMCGMGGDLLAVVVPPTGDPIAFDASGRAGSGADPERLRAEGHDRMPFLGDVRSAPVPGCVDGWLALHHRFGRLPIERVLEPARRYAEQGFPVSPTLAMAAPLVAEVAGADDFRPPLSVGDVVRRPGVARTLAAIARDGRAGFYGGEFGEALVRVGGGEYTVGDLEEPLADWVTPLAADAWDRRLWTVPPNSQGYATLAGAWITSGLELPADPDDAAWAHLLVEAARQAAFDRLDVLSEQADGAALLAPDRLLPRRAAISGRAAMLGDTYAGGGTIAMTVVDRDRLGISLIQSNAFGFGCHVVVPEVGIFLHNRGIGFSLEAGHPAEYGPGRRPPHTLSPTAVTHRGGGLDMVLGTMGGDSQPQILLQLLARRLVNGASPGAAVDAGRWVLGPDGDGSTFDTWQTRGRVRVLLEATAPTAWREGLETRGHRTLTRPPGSTDFGHAHMIAVEGDLLAGATDPRPGAGGAVGY